MHRLLIPTLLLSACANTQPIDNDDISATNKRLVSGLFDAMERGDLAYINQAFAPDGESIIGSTIRPRGGPHDSFAKAAPFPAGLDDRSIEIEALFSEDNMVGVQSKICGVHARKLGAFAPSNQRICARYTNIYTIEDGRIIKNAVGFDRDLRPTLEKNAKNNTDK